MFAQMMLWLCLVMILGVAAVVAARRFYAYRRAVGRQDDKERKCVCGYILQGMSLPRCPECGRAVGFDKTFEELGVRPEELRGKERP
jgi:hypothetical protein